MRDKLNADLTVLILITIASTGLIAECLLEKWEFWMAPMLAFGIIAVWGIHVSQYGSESFRESMYVAFGVTAAFFHGVHETSFFDMVVIFCFIMLTYAVFGNVSVLNVFLAEYILLFCIQIMMAVRSNSLQLHSLTVSRIILHVFGVLATYQLCKGGMFYRRMLEDRIKEREEDIQESDRDVEDFLSNISHEFRTPINVVNGMSSLILQENNDERVMSIRDAGIRLSRQIEDIQDYTEIDRGQIILEEETYSITSLLNDVIENLGIRDRKDIPEVIIDLAPSVPVGLYGDYKKIYKIIRHLLSNAIKFTEEGGIYIRILAIPREYGVNLSIEVRDTGIGMSRQDLAQVSKGLYQANKKRNRSTGGIGLGLSIVYGFVHRMNGFVKLESEPGVGTRVRISIPQEVVDSARCISLDELRGKNVIYYVDTGKFMVPQVRDFYHYMASNLAGGLECNLYPATNTREIDRICAEMKVSHIVMGEEEYMENTDYIHKLVQKEIIVMVSSTTDSVVAKDNQVILAPRPLYGYTVSKVLRNPGKDADLSDEGKMGKPYFDGVRALIVDDEPLNLVVATGLFRDYHMTTDTAGSGMEAIEKFKAGSYDVVFMDHMMPGMDGVAAMKELKKISKTRGEDTVMIVLTANTVSGAKEMFLNEGFHAFIAKPIDTNDFERTMRRVMPTSMIRYTGGDDR